MIAISHAHAAKPQRKVDRASHPEDTVIDLGGCVKIGGGHFQVIAGPCSTSRVSMTSLTIGIPVWARASSRRSSPRSPMP